MQGLREVEEYQKGNIRLKSNTVTVRKSKLKEVNNVTKEEFKSFKNSIAYHAVRFDKGEIDKDELITALEVSLGSDTFKEVTETIEKRKIGKGGV